MSIRRYVRPVENVICESLAKRRDDKEGNGELFRLASSRETQRWQRFSSDNNYPRETSLPIRREAASILYLWTSSLFLCK